MNIDNAAITRHLKQLDTNEMIVRRKNPDDNRITLVSLTEEGEIKFRRFKKKKNVLQHLHLKD